MTTATPTDCEVSCAPTVQVVILNYNGGDLTPSCLNALAESNWPREHLHVTVVDNDSQDGSAERIAESYPWVELIRAPRNLGFAGGNNLSLRSRRPRDFVALLNNDTTVEPGWLRPLVDALLADQRAGAACPKILFESRYSEVRLSTATSRPGRGDNRMLGVRLSGLRVDGEDRWSDVHFRSGWYGPERASSMTNDYQWSAAEATLWAPAGERLELQLSARQRQPAELSVGPGRTVVEIDPTPAWHELPGGGQAVDVINNAGNCLIQDGYGADRGYHEPDLGQYETQDEVFGWCGASVLLRPEYLDDVGLFDERLFLYYEDFDLSWGGRARGWRYVYVPTAVVRHAHSASTVRDSDLSQYYIERNRLLVLVKNAPLKMAASAIGRYVLSTVSYARRDIISTSLRGTRPTAVIVRRRLRTLLGFLRLVIPMTISRHALRSRRTVDDEQVMAWLHGGRKDESQQR